MLINKKINISSSDFNHNLIGGVLPFSPSMAIDRPDCWSEPHRVRVLYDNDISIPSRWCPTGVVPKPGGWFGIAFPSKYIVTSVCILDYNYSPPDNSRIKAGKFRASTNSSFSPQISTVGYNYWKMTPTLGNPYVDTAELRFIGYFTE
mgnify:CR=1 FL=1